LLFTRRTSADSAKSTLAGWQTKSPASSSLCGLNARNPGQPRNKEKTVYSKDSELSPEGLSSAKKKDEKV